MKTSIKLVSLAIVSALATTAAHASNTDVNNFLAKANAGDFQESVNAYDNMNMRDREVVAGIADKTNRAGFIRDVIGRVNTLNHKVSIPEGWQPAKTLDFLRAAHQPAAISAAPVQDESKTDLKARFAALKAAQATADKKAAFDGMSREAQNRMRTAEQHPDYAVVQTRIDADAQDSAINKAQDTADQAVTKADAAQYTANTAKSGVQDVHHQVMVAQIDIDKNAADIKTNSTHIDTNTAALSGLAVQSNANATKNTQQDQMISGVVDQINADNAASVARDATQDKEISANTVALSGKVDNSTYSHDNLKQLITDKGQDSNIEALKDAALQEANRDRTASQHVAAPTPKDGVDGKDGVTTTISKVDTVTQAEVQDLKGAALVAANQARTAQQHVAAPVMKDGVDGKDSAMGADGKDGVTTTITKVQADTTTQKQVAVNQSNIRAVGNVVNAQGDYIQRQAQVVSRNAQRIDQNSAAIQNNSAAIQKNSKRIDDTREDLKKGLNNAAAMSSLHFNGNHDSWALSTGTANGEGAALAGGLQKSVADHAAVTVQFSNSMNGDWMAGAGVHGDF